MPSNSEKGRSFSPQDHLDETRAAELALAKKATDIKNHTRIGRRIDPDYLTELVDALHSETKLAHEATLELGQPGIVYVNGNDYVKARGMRRVYNPDRKEPNRVAASMRKFIVELCRSGSLDEASATQPTSVTLVQFIVTQATDSGALLVARVHDRQSDAYESGYQCASDKIALNADMGTAWAPTVHHTDGSPIFSVRMGRIFTDNLRQTTAEVANIQTDLSDVPLLPVDAFEY
jgi:hypothetical protein